MSPAIRFGRLLAFLLACACAGQVRAETVACPDLAQAALVGTCPSEEELLFTFNGYCSDNARIYNWNEEQVCTDYTLYRRLKNVVLWEARNGDFQAYLSCDLSREAVKAAKPVRISVEVKGKLTRLLCGYGEGVSFSYRTKQRCQVEGSGDCRANPAGCQAVCD